jgi:hypothetical protein
MAEINAYINGRWRPLGRATVRANALFEFPNIDNKCIEGEALFNVIDTALEVGFAVQLTTNGSYSIDWGDGTIETGTATAYTTQFTANSLNAQVSHTYSPTNASGKGIWIQSLGAYAYTVRIYNASSPIKYLKVARLTTTYSTQNSGVVWADIKIHSLVDISQMFSNGVSVNPLRSPFLYKANLITDSIVLRTDYFAYQCTRFQDFNFPYLPNVLSRTYALYQTGLSHADIGTDYQGGSSCSMSYFLNGTTTLRRVDFTSANWASISSIYGLVEQCRALTEVYLPAGVGNDKLTDCTNAFKTTPIKTLTNIEYLGSRTSNCNMDGTFDSMEQFAGVLPIYAKLTKFTAKGTSSAPNKVTSIRLYNATSPFSGTSPQIDVQYCDLSESALNTLFGDLPTVSGKTIKITGCTGAGTCDTSIATAKGWTVSN